MPNLITMYAYRTDTLDIVAQAVCMTEKDCKSLLWKYRSDEVDITMTLSGLCDTGLQEYLYGKI